MPPRRPAPSALRHGKPVGNDPHPRRLRKRGRDLLIDSLKAIRTLAERVRLEFRGEVFLRGKGVRAGGLVAARHDRLEITM